MTTFAKMTAEEKQALAQKVADCLKENGIDAPVQIYREEVCALGATTVEGTCALKVEKKVPSHQAAQAEKFTEEVKAILEGIEGTSVSVTAPLGAGDAYKTITNVVDINDDQTPISLEHKEGEVWLLDFWATWCPPCQGPMAHNQSMLEKHGAEWGDKVKIIGLSIDKDAETVLNHIKAKGWDKPLHYHRATSDCSTVYSVQGVPHVMLIDSKGMIAFKGHPANRPDLAVDLSALLKGEKLTGEGCGPAEKKEGEEEPIPEGFEELDGDAINSEMDKFGEVGKKMQTDLGETVKGMPRAFCVMVFNQQLVNGKLIGKYENFRVLVGTQEQVDKAKAMIEENVKGSFQVVLREQCI